MFKTQKQWSLFHSVFVQGENTVSETFSLHLEHTGNENVSSICKYPGVSYLLKSKLIKLNNGSHINP